MGHDQRRVRFGLVGTGFWAKVTHAPGIVASSDATLTAVWGRDPVATAGLATEYGAVAHADFDAFLADVDAVAFSVPPDVQAALAVRAARAGKHLLLEKPIALDESAGDALADAVSGSGVAAIVFFTHYFSAPVTTWFDEVDEAGWLGGEAYWLGSALTDANPFNTPWRREHGGLWDVGPHAVADLVRLLGPVVEVTAVAGGPDLTHLVLAHEGGASSTCTLTLSAPDPADGFTLMVWGPDGRAHLPVDEVDSRAALTVAVDDLVRLVETGEPKHRADLAFGREVLGVLAKAQGQLDAQRGA